MKKKFIFIMLFFAFSLNVNAKEQVKFEKCVDGDTIKIILNDEIRTVRLLAVDTPESVHPKKGVEFYGKEASNFTCDLITKAKKIELEYDKNSDKEDKYKRLLAWVFVDDFLLQDELVKNGYAEVTYLYGDYKYTNLLKDHEADAERKQIGIWNNEQREEYNDKNNIKEDIKEDGKVEEDTEYKGTLEDTIKHIDSLDINYNNITKENIIDICLIVIASLLVAFWKPLKRKIKKALN